MKNIEGKLYNSKVVFYKNGKFVRDVNKTLLKEEEAASMCKKLNQELVSRAVFDSYYQVKKGD